MKNQEQHLAGLLATEKGGIEKEEEAASVSASSSFERFLSMLPYIIQDGGELEYTEEDDVWVVCKFISTTLNNGEIHLQILPYGFSAVPKTVSLSLTRPVQPRFTLGDRIQLEEMEEGLRVVKSKGTITSITTDGMVDLIITSKVPSVTTRVDNTLLLNSRFRLHGRIEMKSLPDHSWHSAWIRKILKNGDLIVKYGAKEESEKRVSPFSVNLRSKKDWFSGRQSWLLCYRYHVGAAWKASRVTHLNEDGTLTLVVDDDDIIRVPVFSPLIKFTRREENQQWFIKY